MNGRTTIPTYSWKEERGKLTAEHDRLNQEYLSLKDEVKEVEKIRWTVYNLLYDESQRASPARTKDLEL